MILNSIIGKASQPGPPWLYRAELPDDFSRQRMEAETPASVSSLFLDCASMQTLDDFFDEAASALSFPEYFGRNWPAFDECLSEIYEYLESQKVVVFFAKSHLLLRGAETDLSTLLSVLEKVADELSHEVIDGQPWDRPAVSFHAVFDLSVERSMLYEKLSPLGSVP